MEQKCNHGRNQKISEVNNFLKRKYWLIWSKQKVLQARRNPIGVKKVFLKKIKKTEVEDKNQGY